MTNPLARPRRKNPVRRTRPMQLPPSGRSRVALGITAAAHLTPLVDVVDLDGAALLSQDPFVGATISGGQVRLPDGPGLGVTRR